jgi:hypothetical protein
VKLLVLGLVVAFAAACRRDQPHESVSIPEAGAVAIGASPQPEVDAAGPAAVAGGRASREIEARPSASRGGAEAVDAGCEGPAISLFGAIMDDRCAVSDRAWNLAVRAAEASADGGGAEALRQEATWSGERVELRLVNRGTAPLVVPLRFRPGRSDLPAFTVLAEDERHALFELASPALEDADAGVAEPRSPERVHSARIRLPPGGAARARLVLDTHVVKRLDHVCADASDCSLRIPALPRGHYVLYIGQLLAGIDAGPPARLEWDVGELR